MNKIDDNLAAARPGADADLLSAEAAKHGMTVEKVASPYPNGVSYYTVKLAGVAVGRLYLPKAQGETHFTVTTAQGESIGTFDLEDAWQVFASEAGGAPGANQRSVSNSPSGVVTPERREPETNARSVPSLNQWFLALPEGRQKVLVDDKWMLAGAAYEAGMAVRPARPMLTEGASEAALEETARAFLVDVFGQMSSVQQRIFVTSCAQLAIETTEVGAPVTPAGHVWFRKHRQAPDIDWSSGVDIRDGAPIYLDPPASGPAVKPKTLEGVASEAALEQNAELAEGASARPAVSAINFALQTTEGLEFLRCWQHGDWGAIRKEWPEAPNDVFIPPAPKAQDTRRALKPWTAAGLQRLARDVARAGSATEPAGRAGTNRVGYIRRLLGGDKVLQWTTERGIHGLEDGASLYLEPAPSTVPPLGFVLVPKRLTDAMKRVLADEWDWADLLAAAEVITEREHQAIHRFEALDELQEAEAEAGCAATAAAQTTGYKLVLVPDEPAPAEPDWDECKRQAEVATGLKVEPHTMSIVIREVRRWIAQQASENSH